MRYLISPVSATSSTIYAKILLMNTDLIDYRLITNDREGHFSTRKCHPSLYIVVSGGKRNLTINSRARRTTKWITLFRNIFCANPFVLFNLKRRQSKNVTLGKSVLKTNQSGKSIILLSTIVAKSPWDPLKKMMKNHIPLNLLIIAPYTHRRPPL